MPAFGPSWTRTGADQEADDRLRARARFCRRATGGPGCATLATQARPKGETRVSGGGGIHQLTRSERSRGGVESPPVRQTTCSRASARRGCQRRHCGYPSRWPGGATRFPPRDVGTVRIAALGHLPPCVSLTRGSNTGVLQWVGASRHDAAVRTNHGKYGDTQSVVRAVDGVSMRIMPGHFYGLVGESGSGKTTLGRAILMAVPIAGGAGPTTTARCATTSSA